MLILRCGCFIQHGLIGVCVLRLKDDLDALDARWLGVGKNPNQAFVGRDIIAAEDQLSHIFFDFSHIMMQRNRISIALIAKLLPEDADWRAKNIDQVWPTGIVFIAP